MAKSSLDGLHGILRHCMKSLEYLLAKHNRFKDDGVGIAGFIRQDQRRDTLRRCVHILFEKGYQLSDVANLKPKHIQVIADHWKESGLSGSSICIYFSSLSCLCAWVGKGTMIRSPKEYYPDPSFLITKKEATKITGWFEQDIDVGAIIRRVYEHDSQVAVILLIQAFFGLRAMEAGMFRPHLADQQTHLAVNWGTKGNRDRTVPFTDQKQIEIMEFLKRHAIGPNGSMIPRQYSQSQWRNHWHYVLRKNGISREDGLVTHGLRHSYAIRMYEALSDSVAPVKGIADPYISKDDAYNARQQTSEHLGHNRDNITDMYTGNLKKQRKKLNDKGTILPTQEQIRAAQSDPKAHYSVFEAIQDAEKDRNAKEEARRFLLENPIEID